MNLSAFANDIRCSSAAEYYNLPNDVNMKNPYATFTSSAFGKITSATAAAGRFIRTKLRILGIRRLFGRNSTAGVRNGCL